MKEILLYYKKPMQEMTFFIAQRAWHFFSYISFLPVFLWVSITDIYSMLIFPMNVAESLKITSHKKEIGIGVTHL